MVSGKIYVAIPAMNELEDLPFTLQDLAQQDSHVPFDVYVCVNQPEEYWTNPEKRTICESNQQLLELLKSFEGLSLHIIDRASQGKGWQGKKFGVGWARKTLFDHILAFAAPEDIIISLDADTRVRPHYIQSVADNMSAHPHIPAISVPYYHPLTNNELQDRAILRYEFYMRNYAINLYRIGSPYSFTAIGSAIVMRAGALRKIGGITPVKSGEDFYLMQKLRKMAPISNYNEEMVYPAARFSDRVFFGTGPALIKGSQGEWNSYPIYHHQLFSSIAQTYELLPQLYKQDIQTEFLEFLQKQFNDGHLWQNIRKNVKDYAHFVHAFHEKADGLRILQYLRQKHKDNTLSDEEALNQNLATWLPNEQHPYFDTDFKKLTVEQLNHIRNRLFEIEAGQRKVEEKFSNL